MIKRLVASYCGLQRVPVGLTLAFDETNVKLKLC